MVYLENKRGGPVAQLGERGVRNAEVEGSNPFRSTMGCNILTLHGYSKFPDAGDFLMPMII